MAYSQINTRGQTYYLHSREVALRNRRVQRIYFFAKTIKDGALDALPDGFEVVENQRTGLFVLRKKEKAPAGGA